MADELNPENIKQKISAIREVVLNRSNNEIVLVLQYHDYDVDKAIASFMEDGAAQVLKEWNFTGKKSNNKKKKKKNKQQSQPPQQPAPQTEAPKEDDTSSTEAPTEGSVNLDLVATETAKLDVSDDLHSPSIESGIELDSVPNESAVDPVVLDSIPNGPVPATLDPSSLPIGVPPSQDPVQPESSLSQGLEAAGVEGSVDEGTKRKSGKTNTGRARGKGRNRRPNSPSRLSVGSDRVRTISESSNRSQTSSHAVEKGPAVSTKRPGAGLERSVKDLQRSTVSLQRYRNLLNEEIDASVKRIQSAFQELHQRLDDREVALLLELDHVKAHAIEILSKRQQQAVDLKTRTARAPSMTEAQLSELRADIKHFISDRKVDEEIGKTTRFVRDQHSMLNTIDTFGEVVPVKCVYSTRRPSLSSVSSINTTGSVSEPPTPTSPSRPFPQSPTAAASQKDEVFESGLVTTTSVTVTTAPGMSTAEMVELQQRLQENLRQQGISTASPERRRPQSGSAPPQGPGRDRDRSNQYQNRDRGGQGQPANRDRGVGSGKGGRNQDRTGQGQGRTNRPGQNQDRGGPKQDRTGQNQSGAGQNRSGTGQNRSGTGQNRFGAGESQTGKEQRQDGTRQNRVGSGQSRDGARSKQHGAARKPDETGQKQTGADETGKEQGGKGQSAENKQTGPRQEQNQRQNRDRNYDGPRDRGNRPQQGASGNRGKGANSGQQRNREQGTESPQRNPRNQRRRDRDRDRRDVRRTNESQDSANQSQDSGPKPSGQEKKNHSAAPSGGPSGDYKPTSKPVESSSTKGNQPPNRHRNQSPRHNQARNQHQQKGGAPKVNGSVEHPVQNGPKAEENGPKVAQKDMNGPSTPTDALPQRKPKQRGGAQNKEQPSAIPNGVPVPDGTAAVARQQLLGDGTDGTATTNGDWE